MGETVLTENIGKYRVDVEYDDEEWSYEAESDMPTWGIDLSNHRDYKSPTYGAKMPISMDVALDPEPEDKWDRARFHNDYYVLPIFMYDHIGRTIKTQPFTCPWDSGCTGFVYVSKEVFCNSGYYYVKKSWPAERRRGLAVQYLTSCVAELDAHMTGQVYGYTIVDTETGDQVDSCWGFVGDDEYCMEEGRGEALYLVRHDRKLRLARVKELIKNHVPLQAREAELREYA